MSRIAKTLFLGICLTVPTSNLWACPMCKYALESDPAEPRAYMVSILFMMGTIMTLFASVGVLLWWVSRYEKMSLTAAGYQHLFENGVNQPLSLEGKAKI